jgi:hypothetical protein
MVSREVAPEAYHRGKDGGVMNFSRRGLLVAALHTLLVGSIGAKLRWDRTRLPRVWVLAVPYDPATPLRGRYVSLQLAVKVDADEVVDNQRYRLEVRNNVLWAVPDSHGEHNLRHISSPRGPQIVLGKPTAYFIPEHVPDPSQRLDSEELWVEMTVPESGLPRPIRLEVRPVFRQ